MQYSTSTTYIRTLVKLDFYCYIPRSFREHYFGFVNLIVGSNTTRTNAEDFILFFLRHSKSELLCYPYNVGILC